MFWENDVSLKNKTEIIDLSKWVSSTLYFNKQDHLNPIVKKWLDDNKIKYKIIFIGDYRYMLLDNRNNAQYIRFRKKKDAIAFKLRWL